MSDETWKDLEDEAARKISEAMSLLNRKRWDKATPEDRAEAARKMVAGRRRKAKRGKK